jgi:hypothetical protein
VNLYVRLTIGLFGFLSLYSGAGADRIMIGLDVTGEIYGRDELRLDMDIPSSNLTFGQGGISCMDKLIDQDGQYAVGTQFGSLHVRDGFDNAWTNTASDNLTSGNNPVTALCSRADGDVMVGTAENLVYYRDKMDCRINPSGVINGSVNFDNSDIVAVELLHNGHHMVATLSNGGSMYLRDKDDMFIFPLGDGWAQPLVFAVRINDFAVDSNGNIVIALENGWTYTRHFSDISLKLGPGGTTEIGVNWGNAAKEVEMLSNGSVVIGLANGQVHVRNPLDLATDLGNSVILSAAAITAMEVTSNDNVVIASGSPGRTWVRKGSDLTSTPVGYTGTDGVLWGQQVNALAAVVSGVPVDCDNVIAIDFGLETDLSGDCYLNLEDFAKLLQVWGDCMNPTDPNCEHPWE